MFIRPVSELELVEVTTHNGESVTMEMKFKLGLGSRLEFGPDRVCCAQRCSPCNNYNFRIMGEDWLSLLSLKA